jgi:hypothetical protein
VEFEEKHEENVFCLYWKQAIIQLSIVFVLMPILGTFLKIDGITLWKLGALPAATLRGTIGVIHLDVRSGIIEKHYHD